MRGRTRESVSAPELLFRWDCRHCGAYWWTEIPSLLWWQKRAVTVCPFCGKPYRRYDDQPATARGVRSDGTPATP